MKKSKNRKRSIALTLVISLILSLMMSSFAFADVISTGPNNEYCTITHVCGNDNAWNSTKEKPMYGATETFGTDVLGNAGGLPITIQFSEGCESYQVCAYEIDGAGKMIGKFNCKSFIPTGTKLQGSVTVFLPSSWFGKGKTYLIGSHGIFPKLKQSSCPGSTAFVYMLN